MLNIDVAPTLAQLAGGGIDADGRSLVPLLRGERRRWRRAFEIEWPLGPRTYRAFRSHVLKRVAWDDGQQELYLLPFDPFEQHGLIRRRVSGRSP